jgi:hypothetical protein
LLVLGRKIALITVFYFAVLLHFTFRFKFAALSIFLKNEENAWVIIKRSFL